MPNRLRVIEQLLAHGVVASQGNRLFLLCAPAGYGKTSAIDMWLSKPELAPQQVLRIRAFPGSAETFWHNALRVIGQTRSHPSDTAVVSTRADTADSADAHRGFELTMRVMQSLESPLTVVLDDYHHATSPQNDLDLTKLVAANPLLTLVVVARRVSVLDGPLANGIHPVRVFDSSDFALTAPEALAVVRAHGATPSRRLDTALAYAAGWPLALRAALMPGDAFAVTTPVASPVGQAPDTPRLEPPADPIANLERFVLNNLQILSPVATRMLLASAALDAIDLDQLIEFTGTERRQARRSLADLIELGMVTPLRYGDATDYRCHPAVHRTMAQRARQQFSADERAELAISRARLIQPTAPFTGFKLLCAAHVYGQAEQLLAQFITTITDEADETRRVLQDLPDEVITAHPTFAAALLFLQRSDPSTSPDAILRLTAILHRGLPRRFANITPGSSPMLLAFIMLSMASARIRGEVNRALELSKQLESRIAIAHDSAPTAAYGLSASGAGEPGPAGYATGAGSFAFYYREIAYAALAAGDFTRARRSWERLRAHSEMQIISPWSGFPRASTRTITDADSGRNWLLAALYGQAFTEMLSGDMNRCGELLDEADSFADESGAVAPGVTATIGELARVFLAYERQDWGAAERAVHRLEPVRTHMEPAPLLLLAKAELMRSTSGVHWAVSNLDAEIAKLTPPPPGAHAWLVYLTIHRATLNTVRSNFAEAQRVLSTVPADLPMTQIERARLALFSGDDVNALLIAQSLGDAELTYRHQFDRFNIAACAAWGCGRRDEAMNALRNSAQIMRERGLRSMLTGVPYATLQDIATAAREADICDITAELEAVPEAARCIRYGRLTEMELQALMAIAEHTTINAAAETLFVTPATVKKHLNSVYRKLHSGGRDEAILQGARMGLIGNGAKQS